MYLWTQMPFWRDQSKKAPGYDSITGQLTKNLSKETIASFGLKYVPQLRKITEIILIPEAHKPPNKVEHLPNSRDVDTV